MAPKMYDLVCAICGKPFTCSASHAKYCSDPCRKAASAQYFREKRKIGTWVIFNRDGCRCIYCGANSTEAALHADHIEPRSSGGLDVAENLVTSCSKCNTEKSTKTLSTETEKFVKDIVRQRNAEQRIHPKTVIKIR